MELKECILAVLILLKRKECQLIKMITMKSIRENSLTKFRVQKMAQNQANLDIHSDSTHASNLKVIKGLFSKIISRTAI